MTLDHCLLSCLFGQEKSNLDVFCCVQVSVDQTSEKVNFQINQFACNQCKVFVEVVWKSFCFEMSLCSSELGNKTDLATDMF